MSLTVHSPIRARLLARLSDHVVSGVRRWGGQVPVDTSIKDLAHDLSEPPDKIVSAMYALQKQGLVTFKERKGPHGNEPYRIRMAESVLKDDVQIEDQVAQEVEETIVAAEIAAEAVQSYPGTTCTNRAAAPTWCVTHDSNWPRGDKNCAAEWERILDEQDKAADKIGHGVVDGIAGRIFDMTADEVAAPEQPVSDDLPVILVPPSMSEYPAIVALIGRKAQMDAIRSAAAGLEEVGLDDLALEVLANASDLSPLEQDVLRLAQRLLWMDEDA
jgi:hypothetical protein